MAFELVHFPDDRALAAGAAQRLVQLLEGRQPAAGSFTIALSGGRVTAAFFDSVVERSSPRTFAGVHFFWADERCVPPEHPDSNFALAWKRLLQPLQISADNIHRLRGEADPAFAVAEAEAELCRVAELRADGLPLVDLVLLGMGEDGHVASLFPGAGESVENARLSFLHISNSPKPPPNRLTLTYEVLTGARDVWVLASGKGKEAALKSSLAGDVGTPLGRVLARRERSVIFTDISLPTV